MSSFERFLEKAIADQDIHGAAMVAKNKSGTLNYSKSVGLQSPLTDPSTPYSPSTIQELASMTKLLTTIAALQLVERGLVTLDEDVAASLPSLASQRILKGYDDYDESNGGRPLLEPRRNPITLRQLLTHSAGAGYTFVPGSPLKRYQTKVLGRPLVQGATIDERFDQPLLYEPGEGWAYSSSIDRAGQLVEKISGTTLEAYFQTHIFAPLGIRTGTFWPDPSLDDRRSAVSFRDAETGRAVQRPGATTLVSGTVECFGGQGVHMSTEDYMRVLASLLHDDGALLRPDTAALMFTPQLSRPSKRALLEAMEDPSWAVGHFPLTGEYDWGLGGILVDGHSHEFRKKGALMWGGAANLTWFIDREAGVCGVFGTQLYPPGDSKVNKLHEAFEKEVYELGATR
ncbi:hypothetical protein PFICI_09271 [Pestalotiopsis fici W106-1]|uniref:Beta-lactamase-related domain-containing protein n=1 Tax=Pestalotiopsis fici (strain W106-1 / CGMCC3.15140) TaxID=1229662 RepID=W3WZV9_PESFW|nr:uncharacterized protein PFICI_09271 [Pestalotiopsis fici W106-1]ETS79418.1 hypothetical protein PFICI_09271 [Pestalotiopsis fici W106-1]